MENIVYYIALFLLVFGIRFFKLKKQYKQKFKEHTMEVLHVSLDLVYTASGIVIALLLNIDKSWLGAVLIVYLLFVIFSALLEMAGEDEFSMSNKTVIHGIIVFLIITLSVLAYSKVIPKVDINGNKMNNPDEVHYKIIVPYSDLSLEKHVGKSDLKTRRFYYSEILKGNNPDSLRAKAINNLRKKEKPLFKEYGLELDIFQEEISVDKICDK